jgi:hypothetical protein
LARRRAAFAGGPPSAEPAQHTALTTTGLMQQHTIAQRHRLCHTCERSTAVQVSATHE